MKFNSSKVFRQNPFAIRVFLLLTISFFMVKDSWSQKRQLSPSSKVEKEAYVDHSRVRKEFKAFNAVKDQMAKDNLSKNKTFQQALKLLEDQFKEEYKLDSIKGGLNQDKIKAQFATKRQGILTNHQLDQKKRTQDRMSLMLEFEKKIISAIDIIVAEGGFTEVKPFVKSGEEKQEKRGLDITESIIKKLN